MECKSGIIEPGDLIVVGSGYDQELGFFKGPGRGTIQYYNARYLAYKLQRPEVKCSVSYIGGSYARSRVAKYSPDLVTDPKEREYLQKAIEHIRQTEIVPIKY